jgi:iron complex outermembrane recepter protein
MTKPVLLLNCLRTMAKTGLLYLVIISLFSGMSYAHKSHAQGVLDREVTLQCAAEALESVLNRIEQNAEVKFIFSPKIIQSNRAVTLNFRQEKLSKVLDNLLRPMYLDYEVAGNKIVLSQTKTVEASATNESVAEQVSGKVKTVKGEALPGVSVLVKGTTKGSVTGVDGGFKVDANKGQTLVFSFIGYTSKEVAVGDASEFSVILEESASNLADVVVVGSRFAKPRTDVDRPVAIDVISTKELQSTGQVDLGQSIHYTAPSFSAVKFGINDSAPFVDPASLRGLGPDQVLVTVNNKRRHKVSFVSINDGVGKGQVGTDINVVPTLSLKRVEVLRDGAAAQYGSDAIGGVINLELNDASSGGAVSIYTGIGSSTPNLDITGAIAPKKTNDGLTYNFAANVGMKLTEKGFLNATLTYNHSNAYDRSGTYKASAGFYVKDPAQDAALVAKNNIDLDRAILGAADVTTKGIFINAGLPINDKFNFYAFGGYTNKHVITGVFTRPPSNVRRSVLSKFPNGYNPVAPADLQDFSLTAGIKGQMGNGWKTDLSIGQGSNKVDFYAENTVNPSLGDASPTSFYVGQTKVTQTLVNADIAKTFNEGSYPNFSLGAGTEFRYETFGLKSGDPASYEAGPLKLTRDIGSSGREGFSNKAAGNWNRTNIGLYVEGESDITKNFLIGGAVRVENYSDFGANVSYKLNTRIRIAEPFSIRGSVSRGFRAPSMTQAYYSNFVNISFDNAGNSIINPIIPATSDLAKVLGVNGLKQETSFDLSGGITSKIGDHFTLTADVYQIDVDNRIMLSGAIDVSKFQEFKAAGFPQTANVFVNAIDTRTKGFEFVANYNNRIGSKSKITLNAAYSSMVTTLRGNRKTDKGIEVADATATLYITDGLPKNKFIGSINFDYGKFSILLRASRFGTVADPLATLAVKPTDPTAPNYQIFAAKTLTDIAVTFRPIKKMSITAGINNIAEVYPDLLQVPQTTNEVVYSRRTNQFGTQGRFLNFSLNYNF